MCFLRPVQQRDASGHCFFAYPLYSRETTTSAPAAAGGDGAASTGGQKKALFQVSTEDDINDIDDIINDSDEEKPRELISFSDYFVAMKYSTVDSGDEDEEEEEQQQQDEMDQELIEELQLNSECLAEAAAGGQDSRDRLPRHWEAVSNSFGRQALGCTLGLQHMPQMCRSFPLAPELSQADFWHVRTAFWRKRKGAEERGRRTSGAYVDVEYDVSGGFGSNANASGNADTNAGTNVYTNARRSPPAPGWQAEEHFVVVESAGCEGFFVEEEEEVRRVAAIADVLLCYYLCIALLTVIRRREC